MTEKTLFLDFDGVLHPSISEDFFTRNDLLWSAIHDTPPRIVVSSSWRFQHTLKQLKQLLGPDIGQHVIGTTGKALIGKHARFEEINHWIFLHRCTSWIILDDSRYEFPENLSSLLLCDARTGLTQDTANQLKARLQSTD